MNRLACSKPTRVLYLFILGVRIYCAAMPAMQVSRPGVLQCGFTQFVSTVVRVQDVTRLQLSC